VRVGEFLIGEEKVYTGNYPAIFQLVAVVINQAFDSMAKYHDMEIGSATDLDIQQGAWPRGRD